MGKRGPLSSRSLTRRLPSLPPSSVGHPDSLGIFFPSSSSSAVKEVEGSSPFSRLGSAAAEADSLSLVLR